jgi:hypothetical protein
MRDWSRITDRPATAEDALGIFDFALADPLLGIDECIQQLTWEHVCALTGIIFNSDLKNKWKETGPVVIPGLMRWWSLAGLQAITRDKFRMYLHHQASHWQSRQLRLAANNVP